MDKTKRHFIIAGMERGPGPGRYFLPSSCGYMGHDRTKREQPAYVFGQRNVDACETYRLNGSPGPIYFVNPTCTRSGKEGTPKYSILGRPKDINSFNTPSPGAYSPEKVHPQGERFAPIHSMSTRTRYRKRDSNPASNRYKLPSMLGSNQPDKRSYPSYSMRAHSNVGSFAEDLSKTPGPCKYQPINPNVIRMKNPQYSLQGRSYMPGDNTVKPGPGAHKPELVTINKPNPAKHSLGIRHSEFVTPMLIAD